MAVLSNIKIGKRLGLGFAAVLIISVVISVVAIWRLQVSAETTRAMMREPLAKERMVSDWTRNIHSAVRRTSAIARSNDPSLAQYFAADQADASKSSVALKKAVEPLLTSDNEKAVYARIVETRERYNKARDTVIKLKLEGHTDEAAKIFDADFQPAAQQYQSLMQELLSIQRTGIDELAEKVNTTTVASLNALLGLTVILIGIGVLCAWRLTVGITRPLTDAVDLAHRVASGDLSAHIPLTSGDEIGQVMTALRDMNDSLKRVVSGIRAGTESISTASREIATGNADLSSRTEQQASSLERTAGAMKDLVETVRKNATAANEANRLAVDASDIAAKGGNVVSEVVENMGSIKASSDKIVDIIGVIHGIAFQTNILALNAAVEAARAGEQGRGFAVVASEVRNLAQRSAGAAKEIKALISDSVERVESGNQLVRQAGLTMAEIVGSVQRFAGLMHEIRDASRDQSEGIDRINGSIGEMEQMTRQNAALVEEAAAAAGSMSDQAERLYEAVGVFKLSSGTSPRSRLVLS